MYRFGLDIGANSIGWCCLKLNDQGQPVVLIDAGVRLFPDGRNPKDGNSNAVERRLPRQQRRQRDRRLQRQQALLKYLIHDNLFPDNADERKSLEKLDPYELRFRGLHEKLTLHELGRALFHINQRRGFKSNRKVDRGDDDTGKIKTGIQQLREHMHQTQAATYGAFLHYRRQKCLPVRVKMHGQGAKAAYEYYPDRSLLEEEFAILWNSQAQHHKTLTEELKTKFFKIIFSQRPLRPVPVGQCFYIPEEKRAPNALPIVQHFRIYQEVNNLRILDASHKERDLTKQERDAIAQKLLGQQKVTFDGMRRLLKLPDSARFNLESEKRKDLKGDETAKVLSDKKRFGKAWRAFKLQEQMDIVHMLINEEDEAALVATLRDRYGLKPAVAASVANAPLPQGHSRLGVTALSRITEALVADVITYDKAVLQAGFLHHSDFRTGEIHDQLPYYGQLLQKHVIPPAERDEEDRSSGWEERYFGKITNPTVHIVLNQLRKLMNALIECYGHPEEIVLELARELKMGKQAKDALAKQQKEHQEANDARRLELERLGLEVNPENLLRMRLWEELNPHEPQSRRCPYTGEIISINRLFSPEVEVEHILPFSRTLDNSPANKTVSMRWANRFKKNQSPYEAFASSPKGIVWEEVLERSLALPKNKRWRFGQEAMDRFEGEHSFLDRHLVETQYTTRLAKEYLSAVCDPNKVWGIPGRLTALLRRKWGLGKSRLDHRHHALDAIVVGVTDRGMLQAVSRASARDEELLNGRFLSEMPLPWPAFRQEVLGCLEDVIVSHKPDHGVQGALHNDTAYGFVDAEEGLAVHRVPLVDLKALKNIKTIRDRRIRDELLGLCEGASGTELRTRLEDYSARTGIQRVRIVERLSLIPIRDNSGRAYKGVKGDSNAYMEVYADTNGSWRGDIISTFDANQPGFQSVRQRKSLPLIMRLFKRDYVAMGEGVERRIFVLVKMAQGGQLCFAEHQEAGNLKSRHDDVADAFKYVFKTPNSLRTAKARKVSVDVLGRILDRGPLP